MTVAESARRGELTAEQTTSRQEGGPCRIIIKTTDVPSTQPLIMKIPPQTLSEDSKTEEAVFCQWSIFGTSGPVCTPLAVAKSLISQPIMVGLPGKRWQTLLLATGVKQQHSS